MKSPSPKPAPVSTDAPRRLPSISDAEWIVMKIIWDLGTATANQVVAALEKTMDWKPKTIHTLLRRLAQKKALAHDKVGREFLYRPLVDAEHCTHAASRSFLDQFFDGRVAPFLACFLEREHLTPTEIAELRQILNKKRP